MLSLLLVFLFLFFPGIIFPFRWMPLACFFGCFLFSSAAFSQSKDSVSNKQILHSKKEFDFSRVIRKLSGLSDFELDPPSDTLPAITKLNSSVLDDLMSTRGYVDLNYSYGLNTVFIDTSRSIGSIFNVSGDFSTSILNLPLSVSFNYSTLKVPLGANNYFRLSLDKDRLIEQQKEKLTGSLSGIDDQQAALSKKQAELSGLMGYVEVYLDKLKRMAEKEVMKRKDSLSGRLQDSLSVRYDSLKNLRPDIPDSLKKPNYKHPDLSNPVDYQLYYDSVMKVYQRISSLKNKYDSLSHILASARELITSQKSKLDAPALGKGSFLESIRTLDIGLTYPKTTGLSGQNVPIKGLHAEIQHGNVYLSVASGLTLNNLMLSTNEIQNQLNYSQNVFNNFDFQQILNNGWLTAIKTGYGTPEGTHAFVGINYLTNTRFLDPSSAQNAAPMYDPAASLELDFRYVPRFYQGGVFDLVYGKTSANKLLDTASSQGVFESLFSGYPSNLLLAKYTQAVSAIKSDFSLAYRRMDVYANTTTFGMMQPNNQRIEFSSNHQVAKFMKLGLLYKLDETLRSLAGMNHLRLHVTGGNLSGSYTSYFTYSFFLNHVHHVMRLPNVNEVQTGNNYLLGLGLTSNYEAGQLKANTVLSYNDYLISDSSGLNKYTQFGLIQTFGEKKYTVSASYDYFFRRASGVAEGTSVFGVSGKYAMEKVKLSAGIKLASDFSGSTSLGGHLEALWQAYRFLDVSVRAERFVLGDFYRTYYRSQYEQFPYLITLQTRFKL